MKPLLQTAGWRVIVTAMGLCVIEAGRILGWYLVGAMALGVWLARKVSRWVGRRI